MHLESNPFSGTASAQDILGISKTSQRNEIVLAYEKKKSKLIEHFESRTNSVVFRHSLSQLDLALKELLGTLETMSNSSDGFDDILSASMLPTVSAHQALHFEEESEHFPAHDLGVQNRFNFSNIEQSLPNDPLDLPEFQPFFDANSATKRIYAPATEMASRNALAGGARQFSGASQNTNYSKNAHNPPPFSPNKTKAKVNAHQLERINSILNSTETLTGAVLKSLREAAGVSEKEICSTLRMQLPLFDAIEKEQFDQRPAAVYLRGFVVSYLKYLGIDSTELVETFMIHNKQNSGR